MSKEIGRLLTAMVTPFKADGSVDYDAAEKLAQMLVQDGSDGVVVSGTTGESPTLSDAEKIELVRIVKAAIPNKDVVAGTGSNDTHHSVELSKLAMKAGADGLLAVVPYYNKPTQEGLFQHFRAIAYATKLPLVLYSIPGRCGVEIAVDTVRRLAGECRNIVGIKEAGGNADRVSQLRGVLGPRFNILSGDDALTLPFMALGAQGVISVASNIIPREVCRMVSAFASGSPAAALKLHDRFHPLFRDLFIETNPVPIKAALAMLGRIEEEYRLPLVPMNPKNRGTLQATLQGCGLLP